MAGAAAWAIVPRPSPAPLAALPAPAPRDPVLLAAGDIASCSSTGDETTAALLDELAGTVVTLGDNAYDHGTATEFNDCYAPTWGRHKARTRPAPGNHEYRTTGAAGYFDYFGASAGVPSTGYYSYDLGGWHIVSLNSNCVAAGGCATGSTQELWLRADLAAHPAACTLAYWHHARFSSGPHGNDPATADLFRTLYSARADLLLVGHDHLYERFAPQDPLGRVDGAAGIRQFVVGTGGRSHYAITRPAANSEVRNTTTHGILKLTLGPASYEWEFVPVAGGTFTDSGSGTCHNAPAAATTPSAAD